MLAEVKARAEADLRMYQQESTELYNRNLTALKSQLDEDIRKIDQLTADNMALNTRINDVTVTSRGLEGEVILTLNADCINLIYLMLCLYGFLEYLHHCYPY